LQASCNQTSIGFGLTVLENGSAAKEHAGRVREMFATIASRYDLLNHLLSGNTDRHWRRIVATRVRDKLAGNDSRVLDVACGTGDLALTLFEITGAGVVGTDFCRPMLTIAAGKMSGRVRLIEGDALDLPFRRLRSRQTPRRQPARPRRAHRRLRRQQEPRRRSQRPIRGHRNQPRLSTRDDTLTTPATPRPPQPRRNPPSGATSRPNRPQLQRRRHRQDQ